MTFNFLYYPLILSPFLHLRLHTFNRSQKNESNLPIVPINSLFHSLHTSREILPDQSLRAFIYYKLRPPLPTRARVAQSSGVRESALPPPRMCVGVSTYPHRLSLAPGGNPSERIVPGLNA